MIAPTLHCVIFICMYNKLIRIKKIYFNAVHKSDVFFLLVTASNFLWLLTDTWWLTAWRYPCDNWRLRHLCYSSQGWHDTDRKWWKNGRLLSAPIFVVTLYLQCAKKVNCPIAWGEWISQRDSWILFLTWRASEVFLGNSNYRITVISAACQKAFSGYLKDSWASTY